MENLNQNANDSNPSEIGVLSNPKSDLGGFDLVLSMSNNSINHHLFLHHRNRHLPRSIDVQNPNTKARIVGSLLAPKLEFWANDTNPTTEWQASLVIVFGSKSKFIGDSGEEHHIAKDTTLGFFVDIGQTDIENHSHVDGMKLPDDVKDKIKTFDPKYFRVTRLFADLKKAPIFDHLDSKHTSIDLNGQELKTFCDLLHVFLKEWTKGHMTAFHLGFIPLQKPGIQTNKSESPFDFTPTELRTSISKVLDSEGKEQLVLNYLMMTKHKPAPTKSILHHVKNYAFKDAYLRISEEEFITKYFTDRLRKSRKLNEYILSQSEATWNAIGPHTQKETYRHSITIFEKRDIKEIEENTGSLKFEIGSGSNGRHLKICSETTITRILHINQETPIAGISNSTYFWELTPFLTELKMIYIKGSFGEKLSDGAYEKIKEYQSSGWAWWRKFGGYVKDRLYEFQENPGRVRTNFPTTTATANPIIKIPIVGAFTINGIDMHLNLEANAGHLILDLKVDF